MSRNFRLIALAALATACVGANAEILSPEQALQRLGASQMRVAGINGQSPTLLHTAMIDGQPAAYVFTNAQNAGYMVLSADDLAAPVLGYSDLGTFDEANIPANLQYWLDCYAQQIQYMRTHQATPKLNIKASTEKEPIAPLTTTLWNQNAPYNNDAPEYDGKRCVTGCVATAMAQVMKYHNWPDKGEGEHEYTSKTINQKLSFDFGNTEFDWDNMLNDYGKDATDEQKQAVATLMKACGVSVDMDYDTNDSGADDFMLSLALINYFKYDKGVAYLQRNLYELSEWQDIIYDQLKNYGPVSYGGVSNQGGHEFVCDGYSSGGYFHFNWGWGGISDGYYLLTALDPETQGIGGSLSGFNFNQDITINISKPRANSKPYLQMISTGMNIKDTQVALGNTFEISSVVYNYSSVPITGNLGLKLTSSNGKVTYAEGSDMEDLKPQSGYSAWYAQLPSTLDLGTYTATLAWKPADGDWLDIRCDIAAVTSYTVTVSSGTATFSANAKPSISISNVSISPVYIGSKYEIKADITNTGSSEYYDAVMAVFCQGSTVYIVGEKYMIDLPVGETAQIDYLSDYRVNSSVEVIPGQYDLYFINQEGYIVASCGEVTVNEAATPTVTIGQLYFEDGNSTSVDPKNMVMMCDLECQSGYFADDLMVYIFPYTSGSVESLAYFQSQTMFLTGGESATAEFKGSLTQGEPGATYFAQVRYNNKWYGDTQIVFTLAEAAGIDGISSDDAQVVGIYNLQGARVATGTLQPGMYVRVLRHADGSISTEKFVSK